jgi:hypothetical protein
MGEVDCWLGSNKGVDIPWARHVSASKFFLGLIGGLRFTHSNPGGGGGIPEKSGDLGEFD